MIRILSIANGIYSFRQWVTDATFITLGTLMKALTDIDTNTFSESAKAGGNNILSILAYLGMFSVIVGRAFYIYYNIRNKRQELLDKELKYKITSDEHLSANAVWLKFQSLHDAKTLDDVRKALEEITKKTNDSHEKYIESINKPKK